MGIPPGGVRELVSKHFFGDGSTAGDGAPGWGTPGLSWSAGTRWWSS